MLAKKLRRSGITLCRQTDNPKSRKARYPWAVQKTPQRQNTTIGHKQRKKSIKGFGRPPVSQRERRTRETPLEKGALLAKTAGDGQRTFNKSEVEHGKDEVSPPGSWN